MIWCFVKHFVNYIDQYLSHYSLHLIAAVNEKLLDKSHFGFIAKHFVHKHWVMLKLFVEIILSDLPGDTFTCNVKALRYETRRRHTRARGISS